MDDFGRLTRIIRRRWWALLFPALLFFLSALVPAIGTPPQYAVSRTILLTNRSPMNDTGDTLAYDFPAISRSAAYQAKVATLVGTDMQAAAVATALDVRNDNRAVTFTVSGSDPATLVPIRDAAVAVLARDGTLLWGNTSGQTTVNIADLAHQDDPKRVAVWRDQLAAAVLRALAGALLGLLVITIRGVEGADAHAHE
jgi:uncharacterized protein involved in exopolysaccharide biosynthesis